MKKVLLLGLSLSLLGGNLLAVGSQQSLFSDVLVHKSMAIDAERLAAAELIISPEKKSSFSQSIIDLHNKGKLIQRNIIPLLESKNISVNSITHNAASLMISAVSTASRIKKRMFSTGVASIMDGESNLTAENVTDLVNAYRKSGNNPDASLDKDMIIELLKERKNVLVQEMDDKVREVVLNDVCIADDLLYSTYNLCGGLVLGVWAAEEMSLKKENIALGATPGKVMLFAPFACFVGIYGLHSVFTYRNELRSREQEMNYIDEVIEKIETLNV